MLATEATITVAFCYVIVIFWLVVVRICHNNEKNFFEILDVGCLLCYNCNVAKTRRLSVQ